MDKLILSEDEIVKICDRLAKQIDTTLKANDNGIPIILGVMNGALPFMYELVRHIQTPCQLDTIKVSSYDGTGSTGVVKVQKEPDHNLEGKDVVLVEDIIDTGVTMHYLRDFVKKKYKPKNLYVCILIKRNNLEMKYDELADFTGLTTDEQRYIVGFGFDYYGLYRNVPYVFVPSIKDIKDWGAALEADKKLTEAVASKKSK
ncbi:MAG: hypoxanthine phosphoribosyltransferase [Bacilli bacterium]|jgi:hypoxanthine phosphoribosyltransferase|nr:hypoxanthine phosphoribosyltransferase [Bacilli bacterium]